MPYSEFLPQFERGEDSTDSTPAASHG
eukprot:COSAG04_NODE_19918_length_405_cov_0.810458_1_plen_26_part_10